MRALEWVIESKNMQGAVRCGSLNVFCLEQPNRTDSSRNAPRSHTPQSGEARDSARFQVQLSAPFPQVTMIIPTCESLEHEWMCRV